MCSLMKSRSLAEMSVSELFGWETRCVVLPVPGRPPYTPCSLICMRWDFQVLLALSVSTTEGVRC